MARGASTSCGRISIPPTRCRSRTTSPPRSSCRARQLQRPRSRHTRNPSVKLVANCEHICSSGPDDAIHAAYDKQAEAGHRHARDVPLQLTSRSPRDRPRDMVDHIVEFDRLHQPMKQLLRDFVAKTAGRLRRVARRIRGWSNGKPSKNPRYLQQRPDLAASRARLIWPRSAPAWTARFRRIEPVLLPRQCRAAGRRNNPPDPRSGCRRSRFTTRSTTRNCRSCSWISSAA